MTAIDDFLTETNLQLVLSTVVGFHGVGIISDEAMLDQRPQLREALAVLSGSRRFDGRIHGEQVDFVRDVLDEVQDFGNPLRPFAEQPSRHWVSSATTVSSQP